MLTCTNVYAMYIFKYTFQIYISNLGATLFFSDRVVFLQSEVAKWSTQQVTSLRLGAEIWS